MMLIIRDETIKPYNCLNKAANQLMDNISLFKGTPAQGAVLLIINTEITD